MNSAYRQVSDRQDDDGYANGDLQSDAQSAVAASMSARQLQMQQEQREQQQVQNLPSNMHLPQQGAMKQQQQQQQQHLQQQQQQLRAYHQQQQAQAQAQVPSRVVPQAKAQQAVPMQSPRLVQPRQQVAHPQDYMGGEAAVPSGQGMAGPGVRADAQAVGRMDATGAVDLASRNTAANYWVSQALCRADVCGNHAVVRISVAIQRP